MVTALLVILGFFAGLLGALTGIGGGVLLTPILALHFGIPIRQAIGTSLVAVITTSAASSSVHLQRHTTDIRLGMTLELATALGAAVMAYLVGYFNRNALEGLFAAFLLYSAITILTQARAKWSNWRTNLLLHCRRDRDPSLRTEALSAGTGGVAGGGRALGIAWDRRRSDQGSGDVHLHERAADGGDGDFELHDWRDRSRQRHRVLPARRHPGAIRGAAGGGSVSWDRCWERAWPRAFAQRLSCICWSESCSILPGILILHLLRGWL